MALPINVLAYFEVSHICIQIKISYPIGLYGLLIDFACQRYGWTMDYVLWGISYVNLNMLFADAITTVYLSEEERKKLGRGDGEVINADDPRNRDLIRRMISE